MRENILFIIGLIALTDLCDTVNQLFLKSSINRLDAHVTSLKTAFQFIVQLIRIPRIWIGFIFSGISLLIWLFVLSRADLNLAFSLDSMRYIMITLAAMMVLKEKISMTRWLGILCVVLGITLVALG